MEEFKTFRKQFIIRYVGLFLVLLIPFLLSGYMEVVRGFALGGVLAGLFFIVNGQVLARSLQIHPLRARFSVFSHYVLRYVLYFIALTGAIQRPDVQFLGVAVGLLLPRLVILLFYTFRPTEVQPAEEN